MSHREQGTRPPRRQRRAEERKRGTAAGKVASGAALTLAALAASQPAEAATFTVSNLNDAGAGSLRQAIEDANAAAGADVVAFQAGLTGTITLTTGQLAIVDSVDIQGPGAAVISVSGNNSSRVFYLYNGSALLDVTISGLTVTGGNANAGAGIINFDERLVLDGVTLTGNTASGDGGGLWADGFFGNEVTIRNSIISGNTAGSDGGGIYIEDTTGPVLIQNTVISGNDAGDDGGGIYFYDPDTSITIQDSTISGNSAGDLGGGIYLYDTDGGTHLITGTTISGNSAAVGGGLFLYGPDDPFVIENSTISGNQATAGDGGGAFFYNLYNGLTIRHTTVAGNSATGAGGGLFTYLGTATLENSIVGDNTAGSNPDLGNEANGSFDVSFTLVEAPGTANINDNGGNVFNQDPQLGPLQNNGGPTETHLPAAASPVVNAGDPAFVPPPATDQRGEPRVVNGRLDMGAVEVNPGTIQLAVTTASVNENAGTITITATRTGGSDGAVSVSYMTSDGSAVAPGDYTGVAGTLNWASGDAAPKSFQVTIINDAADEPDETFNVTLSNPQGGAVLGANTTEVVTILDDDVQSNVVEIPTMGDYGRMLLVGLCALSGFMMLRRRKGLAAPMLAVSLALGAAGAADAAPGKDAKSQAATLAKIEDNGKTLVIRLTDGTSIEVARDAFKLVDARKGRRAAAGSTELPASQPVVLKVRQGKNGEVKKVRLQIVDTPAQAQAVADQE